MGEFVRHAKMTAWGLGIVLEDRGGQRTVLFADGSRRSFKGDIAAKLLVPAEPESEEERLALERGAGAGGAGPAPVNLALEAQLPNDFSDPQPFLVYADWLEQRGDPRGRLIQAQHRGSAKLERELLKEHGAILVPPNVGKRYKLELTWKLGFIAAATFGAHDDLDERIEKLLEHPSAALLRELVLDADAYRGTPLELLATIRPPRLATLVIGGAIDTSTLATGDLAPLCRLPSLEVLRVTGDRVLIAYPLAHPRLRELAIVTRRTDATTLRHAVTGELPCLTSLSVHCLDGIDDGAPRDAFMKLPALRTLDLHNTTQTRAWLEAVIASPLRTTLRELRLRDGDLDEDEARTMAKQLVALEVFDVSRHRTGRMARVRAPLFITPAARALAHPRAWDVLGIDIARGRVWGSYRGTVGTYAVAVERGTDWAECSCPSNDRPCKHALALHAMLEAGAHIDERVPPFDHYQLASRRRFNSIRE
jgi:uncharacterized protein (TIGR02996 family)